MSKRFGRNQKNRLRDDIKKLKSQVEGLHSDIGYEKQRRIDERDGYQFILGRVREVCRNSSFLPPAVIKGDRIEQFTRFRQYNISEGYVDIIELLEFIVDIHKTHKAIAIKARVPGRGSAAYMISDDAIRLHGIPVEIIAEAISEKLNESLREDRQNWTMKEITPWQQRKHL